MTYESIVDDGQTMTAPIFSADGKSVIYGLNNQLVAVDLRTRVRHVMLPELADWSMFAVAPDGRTLYVESVQRQADVWLLTQR